MSQRSMALLLAASLALNLFFLGMLAARLWDRRERGPGSGARHRMERSIELRGDSQSWLSREDREGLKPERRALRELRREAEARLRAEPFDPAALRASLAALREGTTSVQAAVHETLVRRAEAANVVERRRLADHNFGGPGRERPGRQQRRGPPEPNPR